MLGRSEESPSSFGRLCVIGPWVQAAEPTCRTRRCRFGNSGVCMGKVCFHSHTGLGPRATRLRLVKHLVGFSPNMVLARRFALPCLRWVLNRRQRPKPIPIGNQRKRVLLPVLALTISIRKAYIHSYAHLGRRKLVVRRCSSVIRSIKKLKGMCDCVGCV